MARIYEKPRYTNQARNKILAIASATNNLKIIKDAYNTLGICDKEKAAMNINYSVLADLYNDGVYNDDDLPDYDMKLEQYLLESEITSKTGKQKLMAQAPATKTIRDFLETFRHHNPKKIFNDCDAIFWLIKRFSVMDDVVFETDESKKSRLMASDLIYYQLMPQKIAPGLWHTIYNKSELSKGLTQRCIRADNWITTIEKGIYRSQPLWVKYCRIWAMNWQKMKPHVAEMVHKVSKSKPWERFNFDFFEGLSSDIISSSYNYNGVIVTYIDDVCLIMDNSLLDNARSVFTSIRNAEIAFNNYRMTGDDDPDKLGDCFKKVFEWIAHHIYEDNIRQCENLARHMHLTYTAWQNITCEEKARFDCGAKERHKKLLSDILEVYPHNHSFLNLINSFDICERSKAELLKCYHILPPPDIDQELLHEELISKSNNTNSYNKKAIEEFISFCKTYDFCRYVSKYRDLPSYSIEEGYDFLDSPWYVKCISGKFKMPPEEDWGKIQIKQHFPYDYSSDYHIFEAQDVTRVVADLDHYMNRCNPDRDDKFNSNELLSAIFKGPKLSNGMSMAQWREKVFSQKISDNDYCIAIEAGKAENTKPGKKVRETLSGSDNVREFLTEVDRSLRPLAMMTPGVSIRLDYIKHKRKFQSMAHATCHYFPKNSFATSTDISGWSPKMPRKMFYAWQEYALSTTACPNPKAVQDIWNKMIAVVDRRGYKKWDYFRDGTFQGWPATSDTTMHAHILIYWAYHLKKEKILSEREAAYTLCLIDDAATVIVLEGDHKSSEERALKAKIMIRDMYAQLGFEMDEVKSFFSNIKFVYLNELYIDGSQVVHSTKTFMRMMKDNRRRFASYTDHIGTIFGMAASSANQGMCPYLSYWTAAWLSYRIIYKIFPRFLDLNRFMVFVASIAPVGMNGFGMKLITSVMATGQNDQLTWPFEVYIQFTGMDIDHLIEIILDQKPKKTTPLGIFKNPYAYEVEGHNSTTGYIMDKFRRVARSIGLAEPFKSLDQYELSEDYENAVKHVLSNGTYDAAVLQEVSSNMPEAFVDELMSRIERTEIIACMLSSKEIASLRKKVYQNDMMNIKNLYATLKRHSYIKPKEVLKLKEMGSFAYAKMLRNNRLGGYQVLNHTYPCPFSLWAFNGEINVDDESSLKYTTVYFNKSLMSSTYGSKNVNLYDSIPYHIGYKGYKSVQSNLDAEVKAIFYNPIRKKVAQGLAILRWARESGRAYQHLTDLFLHCWSGFTDFRMLDLPGAHLDTTVKRLSIRHNKANHLINMFPNTQSSVRINAKAITRVQAGTHHLFDIMASITTLRCAGLLEAALKIRSKEINFCYAFSYKPKSAAIVEEPQDSEVYIVNPFLEKIVPFVDIKSDMSREAKVLCNYKSLKEILRRYTDMSDRAATEYFNDIKESFEIDFEEWDEHIVASEKVKILHTSRTYDEYLKRTTLILARPRSQKHDQPLVKGDEQQKKDNTLVNTAALRSVEAIQYLAQQFNDTLAMRLCLDDSKFSNMMHYHYKKDELEEIFEDEIFEHQKDSFKFSMSEMLSISRDLENIAPDIQCRERFKEFMYHLGYRGFRLSHAADDIIASAMSYMGTVSGYLQRMTAVAQSIDKFQPKNEEEYSTRKIIGDYVPGYNIGNIYQATWRLASARYAARAEDMIQKKMPKQEIIKLNYKSKFMMMFSKNISDSGSLDFKASLVGAYNCVLSSCFNFLGKDSLRKTAWEELREEHLNQITDIDDENDLFDIISAVIQITNKYKQGVDADFVFQTYEEVKSWVEKDIKGVFEKVTAISKFRKTKLAKQKVTEPVKEDNSKKVLDIFASLAKPVAPKQVSSIVPTNVTIGAIAKTYEVDFASPHDIFQWLSDHSDFYNQLISKGYDENINKAYNLVTSKKVLWDKFIKDFKSIPGADSFSSPEWSRFPCRYLEDLAEGEDWVKE